MSIHLPVADLGEGLPLLTFYLVDGLKLLNSLPCSKHSQYGVLRSYFNLQSRGKVSRYQEILAQKGEL